MTLTADLSERSKFYVIDQLRQKIEDCECAIARAEASPWSRQERDRVIEAQKQCIEELERGIWAIEQSVPFPLSDEDEVLFRVMRS